MISLRTPRSPSTNISTASLDEEYLDLYLSNLEISFKHQSDRVFSV